jgi:hypothetical protein
MSEAGAYVRSKRTAVLVFHRMGIQRPLETVRAVVNAIWLDCNSEETPTKKTWTHRPVEWTAAMGQFAIHFGARFPGTVRS